MADQTDTKTVDVDKAKADAQAARITAVDAQAKADDATKSKEQLAADKARVDAAKAESKAAEADASTLLTEPMTAIEAKVVSPHLTEEMGAADHFAQKFSNDPANPHIAKGEHADPDLCTVKMTMVKADSMDQPIFTMVHPEMVGDYARAGWNVA
jgi:hypothetical protein